MEQVFWPLFPVAVTAGLAAILLRLAVIDIKTLRLPDTYTWPLILVGLALSALVALPAPGDRVIGAVGGFLSLALIGAVHFRRTGVEGLGLGDAKLFAAAGAWLGWQALPVVMLIAAVAGLIYATAFRRGPRDAPLPFGPMLAAAFLTVWIAQSFFPPARVVLGP